MSKSGYQSVIIIGAPRSGTNILRDVLCNLDGFGSWPCDEINYIWRHGNMREKTDELSVDLATCSVKKFVRREFDLIAKKQNLKVVVEKTCANSLRVPFVDAIIPEAKYIFIYRNGIDVVGSMMKRWKAKLDLPYIMHKARYVPLADLPYYALNYLANQSYRIFSGKGRLAIWGPKFENFDEVVSNHSLEEICALQWKRCAELSDKAFSDFASDKVTKIKYESFVTDPVKEIGRAMEQLDFEIDNKNLSKATAKVSNQSIGKGHQELGKNKYQLVHKLISDTLADYGYH